MLKCQSSFRNLGLHLGFLTSFTALISAGTFGLVIWDVFPANPGNAGTCPFSISSSVLVALPLVTPLAGFSFDPVVRS